MSISHKNKQQTEEFKRWVAQVYRHLFDAAA